MSGIAGFIRLDGVVVDGSAIEAMLAAMARRGPDRQHGVSGPDHAFGQVLLATTPEALAELQPWKHAGDGCMVVSDSRLDNRPELLRQLGIDQPADEVGDARLLHAAWRRWGEDCADHLLGDFAFAIYDPARRQLSVARDVAGIRPLFYHHAPGRLFAFASQTEALRALPGVPAALNRPRLIDALVPSLQGYDNTSSFFAGIQRLPPAHTLSVAGDGRLQLREYWTPVGRPPDPWPRSEQDWADGLRERLRDAVRCRLRGHVRVGSMLSGGLDSSALVALASNELAAQGRGRLATFSAVSSIQDCPETRAIRWMQEHFDLDASSLDWQQVPQFIDRVASDWSQMGEPFDGAMALVECQYMAAAGQEVRVLFDGIDADTLFEEGGYLAALFRRGHWRALWHEARGQVRFYGEGASTGGFIKPVLKDVLIPTGMREALRRLRTPGLLRRIQSEARVDPVFAGQVDLAGRMRSLALMRARQPRKSSDGRAESWIGSTYTTAGLERYGRLAAAQGMESRHPFMDRRLLEYCAWVPSSLRLRDGWPKWLLRRAMAGILPDEVAWRRGKEHLGWRFNHQLFQRLAQHHSILAQPVASPVTEGIDPSALPLIRGDGPNTDVPKDWEARLAAAALVVWRQRVDHGGL